MALADIQGAASPRRLDSWKEIAEYLRRDVRTATRWESQGLPLHRVPGGKGRSVYAFTNEIDAWLAGRAVEPEAPGVLSEAATVPLAAGPLRHPIRVLLIAVACALAVIAVGAAVASRRTVAVLDPATLQVTATSAQVSIADASGAARVLHLFEPGAVLPFGVTARIEALDSARTPDVLAAVSYYDNRDGRLTRSGEVLDLSPEGDMRWRFSFDDRLAFPGRDVPGPWAIVDWQVDPGSAPKRIAVSAHEATWWASVVAVLDHKARRLGTFVNPGWVETVMWRSTNRLAVAGFNNVRDEAMFAMLDAGHLDGQAPGSDGTAYACLTCASATPLFYATFSRSELNRVTAGRFNRGRVSTIGTQIVVSTVEMARDDGDATALYEFDGDLRFIRARYSDTYWTEHQRLEAEGRLTHTRETCPERDGPAAIHIWDAARGWVRTTPSTGR